MSLKSKNKCVKNYHKFSSVKSAIPFIVNYISAVLENLTGVATVTKCVGGLTKGHLSFSTRETGRKQHCDSTISVYAQKLKINIH